MTKKLTLNRQQLAFLFVAILLVILAAGLYPKDSFHQNDLTLYKSNNSLHFEGNGIAYVDNIRNGDSKSRIASFSIEIIFIPENIKKSGYKPLITFHNGDDQQQLAVWQWGDSIIVINDDDYNYSKKSQRLTAREILNPKRLSRITVTSNTNGTRIFHNGHLLGEKKKWQLQLPGNKKKIHMTVGNSVYGKHGWEGDIISLALYSKALTVEEVSDNIKERLTKRSTRDLILFFDFSDNDKHIKDLSQKQQLVVPNRLITLKKSFFSLPWSNFNPSWPFLADAILNIAGFIPLGATLYIWLVYMRSHPRKYAIASTIILCFLLSFGIETIQAWLPDRRSDLLDLILNTFGAYLGVRLTIKGC
jgi:VanZ family protein